MAACIIHYSKMVWVQWIVNPILDSDPVYKNVSVFLRCQTKTSPIQGISRTEEILLFPEFEIEKFRHILYINFATVQPAWNSVPHYSNILSLMNFCWCSTSSLGLIHKHDDLWPCLLNFELSFYFISLLTGQWESNLSLSEIVTCNLQ